MSTKELTLTLALALQGCFSSVVDLEPGAKKVTVVHESDKPLSCKVLGKIQGMSHSSDEKEARRGAENDFRNHALELKANFALIETERSGLRGTSSQRQVVIGGKALFCQTPEMEEAEEKRREEAQKKKEEDELKAKEEKEKEEQEAKEAKAKEKEEAKKGKETKGK